MKFLRASAALLIAAAFGSPVATAAAPLEAYGGLPSIGSVKISPDGRKIAVVMATGEMHMLGVKALPDGKMQTINLGEMKLRQMDWLGADKLIITSSQTASIAGVSGPRREYFLGTELDLTTGKVRSLLRGTLGTGGIGTHIRGANDNIGQSLNVLIGPPEVWTLDGVPTLFLRGVTFPGNYGVLTVFRVNPVHGKSEVVELGSRETDDVVLGRDGTALAKTEFEAKGGRWSLKLKQAGVWRTVQTAEAWIERPFIAGLGRDGASVVVGTDDGAGLQLREISTDGVWGDPLQVDAVDGLIFDPADHRLIGVHSLVGDEDRYVFFDARDQNAWASVTRAFKGDRVLLESWSDDRNFIVVQVDSRTMGPAYAVVNLVAKRASWLGGRYQKLVPDDVSPVQSISFKAQDGLALTGYLTTPRGAAATNLPLIVFPHGGPAARDEPAFDWWAQAMASRGYAVLQVNYRGSDGFGRSFLEAGYGEWGRKMQTDLSDGVRDLAAKGIIDPKRVCIVGASYGGYAALAGAALDPGVYRCAASIAGISELGRFSGWAKSNKGVVSFRYLTRFTGAEENRAEVLEEISPAAHVDRVSIPILLIHGKDDTVVPLEQTEIMANALKKAGKPYEKLVMKGEDHWLSRGDTRLEMLTATMAFVEKHNPPN